MSSHSKVVPPRRCCRCNGSAKCLRCSCVRSGTPCTHCLPGESGMCHNTLPSLTSRPDQLSPFWFLFSQLAHTSSTSNVSPFKPHPKSNRSTFGPTAPQLPTIFHFSNSGAHTQTRTQRGKRHVGRHNTRIPLQYL